MAPLLESLEHVVQSTQAAISQDPHGHATALRALSKKQGGNLILASLLPVAPPTPVADDEPGAPAEPAPAPVANDPLDIVDPAQCTLVVLYILSARVHHESPTPVHFQHIVNFCTEFDPAHARLAPERVTMLAKGIYGLAERNQAISDVHYTDNLQYHYLGGCIYAGLKRFKDAEDFFELTVTAPATVASAVQIEAYKKLTLIQLILYGEARNPPRYISGVVTRMYKTQTTYLNLAKNYGIVNPHEMPAGDAETFSRDNNLGLLKQALARIPFWAVHKLTKTYVSLSLAEIGQAIKIADEGTVRILLQTMISTGEIFATISPSGIVRFEDAPIPAMTAAEGERALGLARTQCLKLIELDKQVARSKSYLTAALRERDHGAADYGGAGFMGEEADYPGALGLKIRGLPTWDEDMS
ncbi:hypothetical protein FRC10_007548 [Ceratobasidium sp. 414]|nr:hypothetical protein FRC10_007548 [Ceratobasidium sp. 414]